MLGAIATLCLLAAPPARAAFDLTQREILASGDVIPGLGVLGVRSFGVDGIDAVGRLLIRGQTSLGDQGLFLADHNGLTVLWRGSEQLSTAVVDAHGRVVALDDIDSDDTTLYEVAGGALRPLLREGDVGPDGETICAIRRVALSDSGALAIGAESAAQSCDYFDSSHLYVLAGGVLRTAVRFEGDSPPDLELIGIARDGTVLYTYDGGGPIFAARDGVTRTLVDEHTAGPWAGQLASIDPLGVSQGGDVVFHAYDRETHAIYRTDGVSIVRVVTEGDHLGGGQILGLFGQAFLGGTGEVVINADWFDPDPTGGIDRPYARGVLLVQPGGAPQIIARDASARGVNADVAVALLSEGDPSGALRWRAGQTARIVAPGAPAPGGGALAIRGFDGLPNCLGADGRVGLYVTAETTTGLLCGDAAGFRAVARSGDPAPGGGRFAGFTVCGMPDGAEILFPAARYGADLSGSGTALYRATPGGIEVAIGPGTVLPGGETITELVSLGYTWWDLRFNARGTLVTRARTDAGAERIVRQRRGQPPEIVRFALDRDPLIELSRIDEVEIAGDDSVVAIALISGRYESIVVSDGERARILIDRDDPRLPFAPHSFRRLIVRGDRAMFVACRGSTSADCGQFVATMDGSLAPLLPDALEQTIVDYTPAGRTLLQMGGGASFLLDGALVGPIQTAGAEPLPIALNDRGNLLWRAFQSPLGGERHSLNLSGPPTESTDCFIPPTAVYQPLPTPTPTIALPPTISPTPTSSATPTSPPPRCEDEADAGRCARLLVGSASGRPGERVAVAVSLESGPPVAGVQNDLDVLDVAPFAVGNNGRPACRANPEIGKPATAFAFLPTDCAPGVDCERVRAIVIAVDNTDAIPSGSVLYECELDIASDADPGRYEFVPSLFGASTQDGNPLPALAFPGEIEVLGSGNAPVAESGGGDGCAVGGTAHSTAWPLLLALLLVVVRRCRSLEPGCPHPGAESGAPFSAPAWGQAGSRALRLEFPAFLLVSVLSITSGAAAAAVPPTAREIVATGDVVERFGRIGFPSFAVHGIDDRGRLLVSGEVSSGGRGLFWAADDGVEAVWSSLAGPDVSVYERIAVAAETGTVVAWSPADFTLHGFGPHGAFVVLAPGDRAADGTTVCRPDTEFAVSPGGVVAALALVAPPGVDCDRADVELVVVDGAELRHHDVEMSDWRMLGAGDDGSVYFTHRGAIVGVRDGVVRTLVPSSATGPSGAPLNELRGLRVSPAGAVAFEAREGEAPLAIYRLAGGVFERVAAIGAVLDDGRTVVDFDSPRLIDHRVAINDAGDVAFEALWREAQPGRVTQNEGVLVAPFGGATRVVAVDAKLHGINAAGEVAIFTERWGSRTAAERWGAAGLTEVLTGATALPDGGGLVTQGIARSPRLADDGRVVLWVQRPDWRNAQVCADASDVVAVVADGDPAPDGGVFVGIGDLRIVAPDRMLFLAARRDALDGQRSTGHALYAATTEGFSRLMGSGSRTDTGALLRGFTNMDPAGGVYAANAAGAVVAIADVDFQRALVLQRPDGTIETPDLARNDGGAPVEHVYAAGIADDGTLVVSVRLADGERVLLADDGSGASLLLAAGRAERFGVPLVRGPRVLLPAQEAGAWRWSIVDLRDGARRPLPIPPDTGIVPRRVRSFSASGVVVFEAPLTDGSPALFATDGIEVRQLAAPGTAADGVLLAVNDRGNALWAIWETPDGTYRNSVHLDGPAAQAACFAPRPSEPRPLPPPQPSVDACGAEGPCARMQVGTASGLPGDRVTLAVRFDGGALDVAGVQIDLVLPPMLTGAAANGRPPCRVNPDIGKPHTSFAFVDSDCGVSGCRQMRGLVLALDSVDPIPNDTTLFECDFTIAAGTDPGRYAVAAQEAGASSPDGFPLPPAAEGGWVDVLADGTGPANPGSGSSGVASDGCQVAPPGRPATAGVTLAVLVIMIAGVLRRRG